MTSDPAPPAYRVRRPARHETLRLRGIDHRLYHWPAEAPGDEPPLVLLHGWMDTGASYQFFADAMDGRRALLALDWRGFGATRSPAGVDTYWFPDYLGDLDALLQWLSPDAPVDLLGHSMGANVAMVYAGVRPRRIRRLVALEGFGLPPAAPEQAPARYARWLEELAQPVRWRPYAGPEAVAARLRANDPWLPAERAAWLAAAWAEPSEDGRWHLKADAAHKRVNPVLYRTEEVDACWREIAAPLLWIEGAETTALQAHGAGARERFETRLAQVRHLHREPPLPQCGHMVHHDQPERLADRVHAFLAS